MKEQLDPFAAAKTGNGTQGQAQGYYPVPEALFQAVMQILASKPWAEVAQVMAALQALPKTGK